MLNYKSKLAYRSVFERELKSGPRVLQYGWFCSAVFVPSKKSSQQTFLTWQLHQQPSELQTLIHKMNITLLKPEANAFDFLVNYFVQ